VHNHRRPPDRFRQQFLNRRRPRKQSQKPLFIRSGIPNDHDSIENPDAFQILIDPHLRRPRWLLAILRHRLTCLNVGTTDFLIDLKRCVAAGSPVLFENVGIRLETALDPLLARKFLRTTGGTQIILAAETVPIASRFRPFVTTKYPKPAILTGGVFADRTCQFRNDN
jgi:hypothetical protein